MNFEFNPFTSASFTKVPVYKGNKDITVFIVTKGSLTIDIAFEKRVVGLGKIFYVGANLIFAIWPNHVDTEGYKITIPIRIWKKIASKNYDFMMFPTPPLIQELSNYPSRDAQFDILALPLVVKILEQQMSNRCYPKKDSFKPLSFLVKPTTDPRVVKACLIISTNYNDDTLTIDSLAKQVGVSLRNMQRLFLNELGITPLDALKRVRIESALHLMSSTDSSLTEIGQNVGYQSHSQFVAAFKGLMGVTPSAIRR